MTGLYRVHAGLLRPGDLIEPGTWGSLVLGVGVEHPHFFREYLFERIRAEFPGRLSRMTAGFAFETVEAANAFRTDGHAFVYRVEPAGDVKSDRLDMSWVTEVRIFKTFEGVEHCARSYWRGDVRDPGQIEVLIAGPVRVLERLTPIAEDGIRPPI